jgi:uncharacterized delta-60 repeat protein
MNISRISHYLFVLTLLAFHQGILAQGRPSLDISFAPVMEYYPVTVTTLAWQPDGKVLVGGIFALANGNQKNDLVRYNPDGTLDTTFSAVLSSFGIGIRAIAFQADGKILVGGSLFNLNNSSTTGILRLFPNGSLDSSFLGTASGTVYSIAVLSNGDIVAGGSFGTPGTRLVRFSQTGAVIPGFPQANGTVRGIAIQPDGKLIVAGDFTTLNGSSAPRIARLQPTGAIDSTFTPSGGANARINSVRIAGDSKILIGGIFTGVNGSARSLIARLDQSGALDNSFNPVIPTLSASIESIGIQTDGKIYIGGTFTQVNGVTRTNVARLNVDGSTDLTFDSAVGADRTVNSVLPAPDGKVLVGGLFTRYGSTPVYRFARLNDDGAPDTNFQTPITWNGEIYRIKKQPDGKYLAAGSFYWVDGTAHSGIVRFLPDGSIDPGFAASDQTQIFADPIVDFEIMPDGKIVIVGGIQVPLDPNTYAVVRLNANGTRDVSFSPVLLNDNYPSVVKAQSNGQIVVAGGFWQIGGAARNGIARINSNGTIDNSFNPVFSTDSFPVLRDILIRADGKILIAGTFSAASGSNNSNIALLNTSGTRDNTFLGTASSWVSSIVQTSNQTILITGSFTSVNGVPRNHVARLLPTGELDTSFSPDPTFQFPTDGHVKLAPDGKLVLTGNASNNLVVLRSNGTISSYFVRSSGFNDGVSDVEFQNDGKIVVGGRFLKVNGQLRYGLARLNSLSQPRVTPVDFDGDGKTDIGVFRPGASAEWWISKSSDNSVLAAQFGAAGDQAVPADYTGDGKTDIAFFRPSSGTWFVLRSEDFSFYGFPFGSSTDVPAPADFDGDGKSDPAVFRDGAWYILRSSDGGVTSSSFGVAGDKPVAADYDGDGKADIGIYRPNGGSGGEWWIMRSTAGLLAASFGSAEDKTVVGDYTGDGKADCAFFRPSTSTWYVLRSEDLSFYGFPFGNSTDAPAPGDYDGDGKTDAAVFRSSGAAWYVNKSSGGVVSVNFGAAGDLPVPSSYVR